MLPDGRRFCDRNCNALLCGCISVGPHGCGWTFGSGLTRADQRDRRRPFVAPYSGIGRKAAPPVVAVAARGAWLTLIRHGKPIDVLDAMSSWWTAIHGHGHPVLDAALATQLRTMNHVMFGGLTHEPAARLAQLLVDITPPGLETVFSATPGRYRWRSR